MNYFQQFYAKYPNCTVQDFVKLAYQAEFGCEHIMGDFVLGYINSELAQSNNADTTLFEPISDEYCRVHLSQYKRMGYRAEVLAKCMQSVHSSGSVEGLLTRLDEFVQQIQCGHIDISLEEANALIAQYRQMGCPALHHSQLFRDSYQPHYRVIYRKHARLLPVIHAIDELRGESPLLVAIDGKCGSGKSYYAKALSEYYNVSVIHCDDFFLPKQMRTVERLDQVGGNVHYERLRELLAMLKSGKATDSFTYQAYNCLTDSFEQRSLQLTNVILVEGSYALHPLLREFYDLKVLLTVDPQTQRERLLAREGEGGLSNFVNKWIPLENRYFDTLNTKDCIVLKSNLVD